MAFRHTTSMARKMLGFEHGTLHDICALYMRGAPSSPRCSIFSETYILQQKSRRVHIMMLRSAIIVLAVALHARALAPPFPETTSKSVTFKEAELMPKPTAAPSVDELRKREQVFIEKVLTFPFDRSDQGADLV